MDKYAQVMIFNLAERLAALTTFCIGLGYGDHPEVSAARRDVAQAQCVVKASLEIERIVTRYPYPPWPPYDPDIAEASA